MSSLIQHREDVHDQTNAQDHQPFFQIGNDVTADDFPFNKGTVFELEANANVNDALKVLGEKNLLSAPVYDEKAKKYLGFIDVGDLLAIAYGIDMLVSILPSSLIKKRKNMDATATTLKSIFEDSDNGETMVTKWVPVKRTTPLKEILGILATQTRRVPVIDEKTGRVCKIISQSALVSELYKHILLAGKNAPKQLMETPRTTGIGEKNVISVGEDEEAREAYSKIVENKISAVAVLDHDGHLFTCISSKDVRLLPEVETSIIQKGHSVLSLSCRQYVSELRKVIEKQGMARPSIVCAGVDTPLKIIIGKLAETRMHRIFITDGHGKPEGVISVSDIMTLLVQEQIWG